MFRETQTVFIDLLRGELRQHTAEVALQILFGDLHDLLVITTEKSFDRVVTDLWISADFHIGDRLNIERSSALGVGVVHLNQHGQQGHVHAPGCFKNRFHKGATAIGNNAVALDALIALIGFGAGHHQHFIGSADANHPAADQGECNDHHKDAGTDRHHCRGRVTAGLSLGKNRRRFCCQAVVHAWDGDCPSLATPDSADHVQSIHNQRGALATQNHHVLAPV